MKQRSCRSCRQWYDASEPACPDCGREGPSFNKALRTAQLNAHLFGMAQQTKKEHTDAAHFVRAAKAEQARVARS